MSKNRTTKNKYPSRYSPNGWVHAAQYITELICENKAKIDKKELPIKFWELKEWLKFYKYQITVANNLIRSYGENAIIAAIKDQRASKTYSLKSPIFKKICIEYKNKQEISKQIMKDVEYDFSNKETYSTNNNKKSIISKLKELE